MQIYIKKWKKSIGYKPKKFSDWMNEWMYIQNGPYEQTISHKFWGLFKFKEVAEDEPISQLPPHGPGQLRKVLPCIMSPKEQYKKY